MRTEELTQCILDLINHQNFTEALNQILSPLVVLGHSDKQKIIDKVLSVNDIPQWIVDTFLNSLTISYTTSSSLFSTKAPSIPQPHHPAAITQIITSIQNSKNNIEAINLISALPNNSISKETMDKIMRAVEDTIQKRKIVNEATICGIRQMYILALQEKLSSAAAANAPASLQP